MILKESGDNLVNLIKNFENELSTKGSQTFF